MSRFSTWSPSLVDVRGSHQAAGRHEIDLNFVTGGGGSRLIERWREETLHRLRHPLQNMSLLARALLFQSKRTRAFLINDRRQSVYHRLPKMDQMGELEDLDVVLAKQKILSAKVNP